MTPNADYRFQNRWRVTGTLTTTAPLRVGSGGTTTRPGLVNPQTGKPVEVAAVATGHDERPYVPGSALKGNLRSWAARLPDAAGRAARVEQLFGHLRPETDAAGGGRLAFAAATLQAAAPAANVPYHDPGRGTGVVARVALHRATKTALPERLFHLEFVPAGATFAVVIDGQDLSEEDVVFLLAVLGGFNAGHDAARLGAEMANGWGRCAWALTGVSRVTAAEAWGRVSAPGETRVGYDLCDPVPAAEFESLTAAADALGLASGRALLTLDVSLTFDGPFLVNDPSRCKSEQNPDDNLPNHAPRLDAAGRAVLPSSSVRGAVRARAEKIVRTLNPGQATPPDLKPLAADATLTFIEHIFGHAGSASAVRFSDFTSAAPTPAVRQEFIAIDRFTGGGADGLKFNAEYAHAPTLTGTVTVNLDRLDPAHLGLLALTLRDLIEGDIPFGLGWAKGYGSCTAVVTGGRLPALAGLAGWADEAEFLGDLARGAYLSDPAAVMAAAADALTLMLEKFQAHMAAKGS